jgi:hypothetical protein
MATRYLYNDKKYTSLWSLRQAIWQNEHKAYGNPITQQEWDEIGIKVTVEEYDPLDEMNLEALRARCLSLLESQFTAYRNASTTYVNSSLGFKANANITAYNNVDGILLQAEMGAGTLSEGKIAFMDFDNQVQMLDADQLKMLKLEISENGSRAYGVKWQYRTQIEQAQTNAQLKELMAFNFDPVEEA